MNPPDTPFAGQGGSYYINPNGSNTLKRNRDDAQPYSTLSAEDKYKRLVAVPAGAISERDRAERIAALGLTAEQVAALTPAPVSVRPEQSEGSDSTKTPPATPKKGGK